MPQIAITRIKGMVWGIFLVLVFFLLALWFYTKHSPFIDKQQNTSLHSDKAMIPETSVPDSLIRTANSTILTTSGTCQSERTDEYRTERLHMVKTQIQSRGVQDERVLEAMSVVARHWFVPESDKDHAYADHPLPIGEEQTISQPFIVALMTEALRLKPGDKVLEIGTGSGYQAAILAELATQVWTIEISEILAKRAAHTLLTHGYSCIQVKAGDGYAGWPEAAPFDAIIVTCAPSKIPQPLLDQLKVGGRMCIPVGELYDTQHLVLITKKEDGSVFKETLELVRFVPMTGKIQEEP